LGGSKGHKSAGDATARTRVGEQAVDQTAESQVLDGLRMILKMILRRSLKRSLTLMRN
jgi:hypothetical protein